MGRRVKEHKALKGRLKEKVGLYVEIPKGQDEFLTKVVKATGQYKGILVSTGIQLLINMYKRDGVI